MDATTATRALAALETGKIRFQPESGPFVRMAITATVGCTDYRFEFGTDEQWRLVSVSTYGNWSAVHGFAGCDASGWVVNVRATWDLDEIADAHTEAMWA